MMSICLAAVGSFGIIVAIVGYLTVFAALVILYLIFFNIPKLYKIQLRKKLKSSNLLKNKNKGMNEEDCCMDISGQTSAAISMALHLYFNDLHDNENMVMTIKKVSKRYSPWSSKIYGLNNYDLRRR